MKLEERIELAARLGEWMKDSDSPEWKVIKKRACEQNSWFVEDFIDYRLNQIAKQLLDEDKLRKWVNYYHLDDNIEKKQVGMIMAGNIPLVGFHDLLCTFISGHRALIRFSSKDEVLLSAILTQLKEWNPGVSAILSTADMLKGCDAYVATGSNNTSRYFEYYFGKYPSIIRKNKTSVAILSGEEKKEELEGLADDICLYFGLGCRNVTQIFVPMHYDFVPLLQSFKKYDYFKDHNRFKNNYDYNLALLIMNNRKYMSNEMMVLVESDALFSPVSELYYSCYNSREEIEKDLAANENIQCIAGKGYLDFGTAQSSGLYDYADSKDTMQFLLSL